MGHLLLTRREQETVWIGNVAVTILQAAKGRARISILAPKEVKIVRQELLPPSDPRSSYQVPTTRE